MNILSKISNKSQNLHFDLIKSILVYGVGDFFALCASTLILLPLLSINLTSNEYSDYFSLKAQLDLLIIIGHVGLVSGYSRLFFSKKTNDYYVLFFNAFLIGLCWILIMYLVILVLRNNILNIENIFATEYLNIFFLICIASLIFNLNITTFRNQKKPLRFVLFQFMNAFILCSMLVLWIDLESLDLNKVFFSLLLAFFLPNLLELFTQKRPHISKESQKHLINLSTPIFFSLLASYFLQKFNLLYLVGKVGSDIYGSFAVTMQIALFLGIVTSSLGKAIQPYVWSTSNGDLRNRLLVSFLILAALLFFVWLAINLFGEYIFYFFSPQSFIFDKVNLFLLSGGIALMGLTLISDTIIIWFKKPKVLLYLILLSALINVILSTSLVGIFGARGASISQFFGFLFFSIFSYSYSYYLVKQDNVLYK